MERTTSGQIYTVPIGLTVHCARCGKVLVSTPNAPVECYIEEDSSSIFCLTHAPKPRDMVVAIEREEGRVPKRRHRREWEDVYG